MKTATHTETTSSEVGLLTAAVAAVVALQMVVAGVPAEILAVPITNWMMLLQLAAALIAASIVQGYPRWRPLPVTRTLLVAMAAAGVTPAAVIMLMVVQTAAVQLHLRAAGLQLAPLRDHMVGALLGSGLAFQHLLVAVWLQDGLVAWATPLVTYLLIILVARRRNWMSGNPEVAATYGQAGLLVELALVAVAGVAALVFFDLGLLGMVVLGFAVMWLASLRDQHTQVATARWQVMRSIGRTTAFAGGVSPGHPERVAALTVEAGRRLQMPPWRQQLLWQASQLHEIGRLWTDDSDEAVTLTLTTTEVLDDTRGQVSRIVAGSFEQNPATQESQVLRLSCLAAHLWSTGTMPDEPVLLEAAALEHATPAVAAVVHAVQQTADANIGPAGDWPLTAAP